MSEPALHAELSGPRANVGAMHSYYVANGLGEDIDDPTSKRCARSCRDRALTGRRGV
jgi:hypothetical protein